MIFKVINMITEGRANMSTYLFAVPIAAGKTEAFKNYVSEINGARSEEFRQSRKRVGVRVDQAFLQQTPRGDMVIVRLESDNPMKAFEIWAKSDNPFDAWFREKIMIESLGMDLSLPFSQNQQIMDYHETPTREHVKTWIDG